MGPTEESPSENVVLNLLPEGLSQTLGTVILPLSAWVSSLGTEKERG